MSNAFEVILDYNAPKGKTNEKDIFIVNGNQNKLLRKSDKFAEIRDEIVIALMTYASDRNDEESIKVLQKYGIDLKKAEMLDHLNLMQAYEFVGAHGITVDDTYVDDKIVSAANPMFDRDVHLVGFNTVFTSGNSDISDSVYNEAHCDTSICLTVPELIGDYYQNGRVFFIDKFHSENGVIMVSSVKDEIAFLLKTGQHDSETIERVVRLRHLKRRLTEHFHEYQNGQDKIR
jgi:hypothetical protein